MPDPLYGKYRGKVINPIDPLQLGRIVALVPAISELPLGWAMPATPYAGRGVGFFAIPPPGANVWIEFERGDAGYPIWSGCFWGEGQAPASPALPSTIMLKSTLGSISIDDLRAELKLSLKGPSGLMDLVMSPAGVTLSLNQVSIKITQEAITLSHTPSTAEVSPKGITLTCPQSVAMNSGGAKVETTPAAVNLTSGAASVKIAPGSIAIENGAGSIAVSPATVNINKGALEVM
jgi:hypothetical protein